MICFVIVAFGQDGAFIQPVSVDTGQTTTIETYYGARDNWVTVPFTVSNAKMPALTRAKVNYYSPNGLVDYVFDKDTVFRVSEMLEVPLTNSSRNVDDEQRFMWKILPTEIGEYDVIGKGTDISRQGHVGSYAEKLKKLIVVLPFFKDPVVAPTTEVYEGEPLFFNFMVNGLEKASDYKIIRTWKEKTDTIMGIQLDMSEETGNPILKGDVGQTLKLQVLYQDEPFYYLEGDTVGLEEYPEEKLNILNSSTKLSEFDITIMKPVPRVTISRADVPYGERIEFSASYYGMEKGDPVQLNELERPRVINLSNNQNIYQKFEQIAPGRFAIWVKSGLTVAQNGLPIEVKVNVRGFGKEFSQKLKLVKKKK
jgi:hypothetical protein